MASIPTYHHTTPHTNRTRSFRFLGGIHHAERNRRVSSLPGNGGGFDDPGSWDASPEWWGTQGGGWGRNEGSTVFEKESLHGNGLVTVTAHPTERTPAVSLDGVSEWRVLRFNGVTRQSVNRVFQVPGSNQPLVDPDCLAFEYLKTMAAAGWLLLGMRGGSEEEKEVEMCFIGGGGFTLPMFFSSLFPNAHIQSIEIDPIVVEAASSCMGVDEKKVNVIKGDAVDCLPKLVKAGAQLDCVFIDAFDGDDVIPEGLSDPGGPFLPALANALHPERGSVIINVHGGKISSALDIFALFKSDPGFDPSSVSGQVVKRIIDVFSNAILGDGGKCPSGKGCCFSLSTAHQDNIIVVISRGLPQASDPKMLKKLFKDFAESANLTLPFDPKPRMERGLCVW